jgi:SAM-dependent methyltransferase
MFKAFRCGGITTPTPYVKKHVPLLDVPKTGLVIDLGCGNLRNSIYVKSLGFQKVMPMDRAGDFGLEIDLGTEKLPLKNETVDLVLCNYLLCFMSPKERKHMCQEINRVATNGCHLVIELYPAKNGYKYSAKTIRDYFTGWQTIHSIKDRFILRKEK